MLPHILHSDEHILVIDKPAGVPVLPDGWEPGAPYLVKMLEAEQGKLWVVHRLDKVTSGVMVFARSAEAHRALNAQFERHTANKVYHALVNGEPTWEERVARHPLRVNVGHKHRTMVDHGKGKPCETRFRVIKRYAGCGLVESTPMSGRTHQVRVHLFALGHPLVGDILYSAPPTDLIARPALHALSLSLAHPASGQMLTFTAPYPADFAAALEKLSAL